MFIVPLSSAGAYTANGFIVDPGCLGLCAARFRVKLASFSPIPPAIATTLPSDGSIITIEDWAEESGKLFVL